MIATADGKDVAPYPEGKSQQTFEGRAFDLIVPKAAESKPPYSLLVVIGSSVLDSSALSKDGYVVAMFTPNASNGSWATSESKEILDVVAHLQATFPIAKGRLHALAPYV